MILPSKALLRKTLQKKLLSIPPERRKNASIAACPFLWKTLANTSYEVLAFASRPFEINLWPFLRRLCEEQRLLLPKVIEGTIRIYKVPRLQHLRLSPQKIQEPHEGLCRPLDRLPENCLILVPGLAFNALGNRMGHGKGHYDKFLSSFSHLTKWGIGFQEQKCDFIPVEEHDIQMDKVYFF